MSKEKNPVMTEIKKVITQLIAIKITSKHYSQMENELSLENSYITINGIFF